MKQAKNRVAPSRPTPAELDRLAGLVMKDNRPALVGCQGKRVELPKPIHRLLADAIRMMRDGRTFVLVPEDEAFTTQATARFLGVSRQFLVNLLERGEIAFHRVGTHRRVYLKDLLEFQSRRDKKRRDSMNRLFKAVDKAGLYDAALPPGDEKG